MEKKYITSYATAYKWLRNDFVLCNNIVEIDPTIYENMRFALEEYDEDGDVTTRHEIFQWFITDASESEVEFLERHFGLLFTYSELLDCFVLCVDHFGTMWRGVPCKTDLENAQEDIK